MKLPKVKHSMRIAKVLIYLLVFGFSAQLSFAQTPTIPQNLPEGTIIPGYPLGYPPVQGTQKNPPQVINGARDIELTEAEEADMTHEDSVKIALEQLETEDLKVAALRRKIFGYKLFNTQTYDPNAVLNIPTPNNYVLGTSDQLIIDVYGYSQDHHEAVVDPDGYITLPRAGVIKVSGHTIEDAREAIKSAFSKVYYGISNGSTKIKVSLGDVRSIKVTITGEVVAPGTYTMSSLNTVMNALYRSGGPNELGSFREVNLVRSNKIIATLDLYDFLMNGFSANNLLLKDQDVIQVPTYKNRIAVSGNSKRTGYFELIPMEKMEAALRYAGGFAPNAYQHRVKVYRNDMREREIFDVLHENFGEFALQSGDSLVIGEVIDRFTNMVSIEGAVYRPGEYSLNNNKTLKALINSSEGLMTDALAGRISLVRTNDDLTSSNISVNFKDILNGSAPDLELKREDIVIVPSKFELTEDATIRISGAINNENAEEGVELPFIKSMTLEDVLIRVGGLTEAASLSRIEIVRRKKNVDITKANAQMADIITLEVSPDLEVVSGESNMKLEPFDQLFVRKSPNYEKQTFVEVQGEVFYPAVYGIQSKEERISDVIKRAGGLTLQAYVPGATLIRTIELSEVELRQKQKAYDDLRTNNDETQVIKLEEVEDTIEESIDINLSKILQNPGSIEDLMVRDGDIIRVPKLLETVRIQGEVLYPTTVRFNRSSSFKSYISGAGGFTKGSLRRKSYIRYPNGSVDGTKKFLVFNLYPKVEPGSEIIVPQRAQNGAEQLRAFSNVMATLGATLTTLASIYGIILFGKR